MLSNMPLPYSRQIDEPSTEPRALGCCCRVTTALRTVAIIEFAYHLLGFIGCFLQLATGRIPTCIVGIVITCITLWAVWRLFAALQESRPSAIIPYLVYKYIHTVITALAFGYVVLESDEYQQDRLIGLCVLLAGLLVVWILFLTIAHQAMAFLEKKASALVLPTAVLLESAAAPGFSTAWAHDQTGDAPHRIQRNIRMFSLL